MPKFHPSTGEVIVRLEVNGLDDDEAALLRNFLQTDEHIHDVETELPRVDSGFDSERMYLLTIEASAEPLVFIVKFLHTHADAIKAAVEGFSADTVKALSAAAAAYLIGRIKKWKHEKDDQTSRLRIYDADGNVIKVVKVKQKRK